jgi:murein DD-endopeptidase MepM/ murein hydrolase activator NlpD
MLAFAAACLIVLPGTVTEGFAPQEPYGGHWGVDVAVPARSVVRAPLDGVVSFAGEVAGVRSVTIRSGRYRVSLSYLSSIGARWGEQVSRGDPIGRAGTPHGVDGLHVGVRLGDRYVDPLLHARCGAVTGGTLRLLPPMLPALASKD